jgi:hypothetical protein
VTIDRIALEAAFPADAGGARHLLAYLAAMEVVSPVATRLLQHAG